MWKDWIPPEESIVTRDRDLLGFNDQASKLITAINFVKPPVTIGVVGPWGSGKTSFMRIVQEELDKRSNCKTIWFEAWKYSATGELLPALLHQMHLASKKISPGGSKKLAKASRLALTVVADLGIRAVTGVIGAPIGLEEVEGMVKASKKKTEDEFLEAVRSVDLLHEVFAKSIQEIRAALKKTSKSKLEEIKLCVFIDDLDRCSPEQAMHLVEQMHLYLGSEGVIYVLGLSTESIETALVSRYGSDSDLVDEYLQKLIHLQFPVPASADNLERMGQTLALDLYGPERSEIKEFVSGLCKGFEVACENNPRMLKTLIKQMAFYWPDLRFDPRALSSQRAGLVVAGHAIWPELAEHLAESNSHGNHFRIWLDHKTKDELERNGVSDSSISMFEKFAAAKPWFLALVDERKINWNDFHPTYAHVISLLR